MDQQPTEIRDPAVGVPPVDRVVSDAPAYARARRGGAVEIQAAEYAVAEPDRVHWGPIAGGTAVALGGLIVLSVLGTAVTESAFKPGTDLTDWISGPGIYGAVAAFIAMFIGGWVAGRYTTTDDALAGPIHGLLAGAASIVVLVAAAAMDVENLFGFLGGNLATIAGYNASGGVTPTGAPVSFSDVESRSWWTLVVLVVGLALAAIGGWAGQQMRESRPTTNVKSR